MVYPYEFTGNFNDIIYKKIYYSNVIKYINYEITKKLI